MTDNHNFNTPRRGATDWHVLLNKNFEEMDTKIEMRDKEANLDGYTPKEGAKFLATDTEREFIGDGNRWNELSSRGNNPSFDSVNSVKHARSVPEINQFVQDADPRDAHVKITLPTPTFSPDASELPIEGGEHVIIDGRGTVVDMSGVEKPFILHDRSKEGNRDRHFTVRNLVITGNETPDSVGIKVSNAPLTRIEHVEVNNLEDGFVIQDGSYFSTLRDCHARRCTGDGLRILPGPMDNKPNGTQVMGGGSFLKCGRGVCIRDTAGVNFLANAEANETYNLVAEGVSGLQISGGTFEGPNGGVDRDSTDAGEPVSIAIGLEKWARGVEITGCHFDLSRTGILAHKVRGLSIDANRFRGVNAEPGFALEHDNYCRDVTFGSANNVEDGIRPVSKRIGSDRGLVHPTTINDGEWQVSTFGGPELLAEYADSYNTGSTNAPSVLIDGDYSAHERPVFDGANFPRGTRFIGTGLPELSVTGETVAAVRLSRPHQRIESVRVDGSKSTGHGFGIYLVDERCAARDVHVTGAAHDGIRIQGEGTEVVSAICNNNNIAKEDIRATRDNCRVMSSEANVVDDSPNATLATAANVDPL